MANTPLKVAHTEGLMEIYAAICKQALDDYRRKVKAGCHMPARDFLIAAGLVDPVTGLEDTRGMHPQPRRTRRKP
jgi:hypothetical protein